MDGDDSPIVQGVCKKDAQLTAPTELENVPEKEPSLSELRQSWKDLLDQPLTHGQPVYLVSPDFIEKVLSYSVENVAELVDVVGPFDFCDVSYTESNLNPEDNLPELSAISLDAFEALRSYFGSNGDPVSRFMIENPDGLLAVERFPPTFKIHLISKNNHNTRHNANHDRYMGFPRRQNVSISSSKTFADLFDAIHKALSRERLGKFRVWLLIEEGLENLPTQFTPHSFVSLEAKKKPVLPEHMSRTLFAEGIRSSFHVVVEPNTNSGQYILDNYLSTIDASCFEVDSLFKSGGNLGLSNLGNTCYMNSALQCLVHIPELNNYFMLDLFKNDLNKLNPLGCNGEIAAAFSGLLYKLFDNSSSSQSSVTPRDFKDTVGRHSSMFHGYQQQDSQEFTSWLLDTLHEDLNRIQRKPYLEKPELKDEDVDSAEALRSVAEVCWEQHKMRNDSVIVDLFTGLYQSTLVCPTCQKKSVTFDPFNDLTLPLPQSVKWYHTFTIVDLRTGTDHIPLLTLEVELNKTSNLDDLIEYLSKFLLVKPQFLFLYEIFREFFYKDFQDDANENKFLPICELISSSDNICVYIIPHDVEQDMIIPIVNVVRNTDASYNLSEPFAFPLFIVLNKESETGDVAAIERKVEQVSNIFTRRKLQFTTMPLPTELYEAIVADEDTEPIKESELVMQTEDEADTVEAADIPIPDTPSSAADSEESDPFKDVSPGFQIRVFENNGKFSFDNRFNHRKRGFRGVSPFIHVPLTRPHFGRLPLLQEKQQEQSSLGKTTAVPSNKDSDTLLITSDDEGSDFVIIDNELNPPTISDIGNEAPASASSSLEVHDDSNWDNVHALFASVDDIGASSKDTENTAVEEVQTPSNTSSPVVTKQTCLVVDWSHSTFEEYFSDDARTWEEMEEVPNPELEQNKEQQKLQEKSSVSLLDCLRNFSSPEILGEQDLWYCPRCKDHKRATKTIQIWSTGDILTIHLKRFQTSRSFSDKLNMVVDFPIEGLDISEFVTAKNNDDGLIYDLIAVDNHYGGLGGGHYTAAAKNFRDDKWYYFDDSRVRLIDDPKQTITSAAYLLFYRKRSNKPFVGGEKVEQLLTEGRQNLTDMLEKAKNQVIEVMQDIESFRKQDSSGVTASDSELLNLSESCAKLNFKSLDDDDLYSDAASPFSSESVPRSGSKNLRSPATAQHSAFEFENLRKQRLISKDCDEPRSVNINLGLSSSASNLASPEVSGDEMALGG